MQQPKSKLGLTAGKWIWPSD